MEKFEHLEFLFDFGEKVAERIPLGQAAPFFAYSNPDMPAAPILASQFHDWLLENIASAFEHVCERVPPKENGLPNASDQDVSVVDASASSIKALTNARGPSFIKGISKPSYVKQASNLNGSSVKAVRVEHRQRVQIIVAAKRICIANCRECVFYLGVSK